MAQMERLWGEAVAENGPLAVIMIDADDFKPVNDTFGHDAGDEVLIRVARELRHAVRSDDLVCRMGGDEFLVICPRTPLEGAEQVAANAWRRISALRVPVGDGEWRGSISAGVAVRHAGMRGVADLIKDADEAVYAAKAAGRNCVRSSPGEAV
ncbi:MAG: GGDEF domain-containing protein [Gammaproteobacteria bacterium]|nr:GGDEF domain-containing protein [Gammaproteobacteria bacterium]